MYQVLSSEKQLHAAMTRKQSHVRHVKPNKLRLSRIHRVHFLR